MTRESTRCGYVALVLHAHLPFVRHPEHDRHLEEHWLFEAVAETYLPLLQVLGRLRKDRVPARLGLSISPPLASMLLDPLLRSRTRRHLEGLANLAEKEAHRTRLLGALHEVALFYEERFTGLLELYDRLGGDLIAGFAEHARSGALELFTTSATHAVLPLLKSQPASLRAQIQVGRDFHTRCFGIPPEGIWLPECAYAPGLEEYVGEAGYRWFILDSHGLLRASPRPPYATFAPVLAPNGVAVFGRDHASARQVWSRHEGYPGDPRYREFYRDAGFDLDLDHVRPHLGCPDVRGFTGIKYHRVTGPGLDKQVYVRAEAMAAVQSHARHFLERRVEELSKASEHMPFPALAVAPYDAELFGHWWFEGPDFLEAIFREANALQNLRFLTPRDYLELHPSHFVAEPAASTWGAGGHLGMWLNDNTEWIFRDVQSACATMARVIGAKPGQSGLRARATAQLGRELLLAQSSDWPFLITSGTNASYAHVRAKTHLERFRSLAGAIEQGRIIESELSMCEQADNVFPFLSSAYWT